jgi:hypothetical protein
MATMRRNYQGTVLESLQHNHGEAETTPKATRELVGGTQGILDSEGKRASGDASLPLHFTCQEALNTSETSLYLARMIQRGVQYRCRGN